MKTFFKLPAEDRQLAFQQVVGEMGLQAVSVEKDFWVCWTLRELFSMPSVREHLTFKGGTSLSKAWKFIERFSEDIDIIVDKVALGFGGDAAPDRAPSKKQRRERLEKLMEASRQWVQGTLQPALDARLRETLGDAGWRLEVDPDLADGQCLLFHYPALFTATTAGYVRPVVKIELGARSDDWPHETKVIQPYVIEFFPAFDPDATFSVNQRVAQEVLGHSDANLTAKAYTDVPALALHDEIAKLPWIPGSGDHSQIHSQESGVPGPMESLADILRQLQVLSEATGTEGISHFSAPGGVSGQILKMAARAGIEPATK